jgi:hypothetical protein|tara:strand:- start:2257 stop:3138 length:882 start_codon:yes stop_codon:yes gene_type:complete
MATPNIVPRVDQEGGLGTAAKGWGKLFIENAAAGGTAATTISNLDADQVALDINANNTTANIIDITGTSLSGGAGLHLKTADGQNDIKIVSSADVVDYFTIGVTANGATTLTTVDTAAAAANFEVAADGDITLDAAGNISLETGTTSVNSTYIALRKFVPTGTGTNGAYNGGDVVYFGGEEHTIAAGQLVHYKSNGNWELADADAVATADGLLGVALGGDASVDGVLLRGMVTIDHDPGAIGDVLFLSTTAGDCSATAPSGSADIVRVIGYQVNHASNGEIWFCPDGTYVELA